MGVAADDPAPGLVAATASTDTTAPTSAITSPAAGATVPVGTPVTVTGTAADTGGGASAASRSPPTTARPGTGPPAARRGPTPSPRPPRARSRSGAGRPTTAPTSRPPARASTVTVGTAPATCPCTIWPGTATPAATDPDTSPVELGVKFRASTAGFITGIRYYKPGQPPAPTSARLWTGTGTRLANVTFTNESASGWQQATFATPVAVTANTTYVASYFTPVALRRQRRLLRHRGHDRGPLTALQNGTDGGNGVYRYGTHGRLVPHQHLQQRELLGRRRLHRTTRHHQADASPAAPRARRHRRRRQRRADRASSASPSSRPRSRSSSATRRHRGARRPRLRRRHPHRDARPRRRAGRQHDLHRHRQRRQGHRRQHDGPVTWTFTTEAPDTTKPTRHQPDPGAGRHRRRRDDDGHRALQRAGAAGHDQPSSCADPASARWFRRPRPTTPRPAPRRSTPNAALAAARPTPPPSAAPATPPATNGPGHLVVHHRGRGHHQADVTSRTPGAGGDRRRDRAPRVDRGRSAKPSSRPRIGFELRTPAGTRGRRRRRLRRGHPHGDADPERRPGPGTTYTATVSGARTPSGNTDGPGHLDVHDHGQHVQLPVHDLAQHHHARDRPTRHEHGRAGREVPGQRRTASSPASATTSPTRHRHPRRQLWTGTGTRWAPSPSPARPPAAGSRRPSPRPIPVTAGTTYVASYFTPVAVRRQLSASSPARPTRGPLTALQNGTDGGNGVYRYGSTAGTFPNSSYNSENYWVDVVFAETAPGHDRRPR